MTRYFTRKDFSKIHQPDDKPKKVGWYCANSVTKFRGETENLHDNPSLITALDMYFWDGEHWLDREHADKDSTSQDKSWFGLRRKP